MFPIDTQRIVSRLLEGGLPPLAREEGAALAEAWIARWGEHDSQWKIISVETPFYIPLDETSVCVGVSDLRAADQHGIFHCEWKSAAAPKPGSRFYSEQTWTEDIVTGPQLGIYALAMREGHFLKPSPDGAAWERSQEPSPRIRVRACVKSSPPSFWPSAGAFLEVTFGEAELERIKAALRSEAAAIRARQASGLRPWMFVGLQCTRLGRVCEYKSACLSGSETGEPAEFCADDPGSRALAELARQGNRQLTVLSASAYASLQQCPELYRRRYLTKSPQEESYAMSVGSAMHAGLAEFYSQMQSWQASRQDEKIT